MPHILNETDMAFVLPWGATIGPNASEEVTDSQAAKVAGHPLLQVVPDAPAPAPVAPAAPAAPAEPAPAPETPDAQAESDLEQAKEQLAAAEAALAEAQAKEGN